MSDMDDRTRVQQVASRTDLASWERVLVEEYRVSLESRALTDDERGQLAEILDWREQCA